MPVLQINTNVSRAKVTEDINLQLADLVANMLGKPKGYCAVYIVPDQLMSFGGSFEPCAQVVLMSIGKLGIEENKQYSAKISSVLESGLGVPKDRAYIFFQEVQAYQIGFNGSTFA